MCPSLVVAIAWSSRRRAGPLTSTLPANWLDRVTDLPSIARRRMLSTSIRFTFRTSCRSITGQCRCYEVHLSEATRFSESDEAAPMDRKKWKKILRVRPVEFFAAALFTFGRE